MGRVYLKIYCYLGVAVKAEWIKSIVAPRVKAKLTPQGADHIIILENLKYPQKKWKSCTAGL